MTYMHTGREAMDDNVPMIASALAYSAFFAIPSVLLVVLGMFTLFADPQTVADVVDSLYSSIAPADAANLFGDSLVRLTDQPSTSLLLTLFGLALAVWAHASAMTACMTALNLAYERRDRRSFLRKRLTALVMAACVGVAALLSGGLLVLGPRMGRALAGAGARGGDGGRLGLVARTVADLDRRPARRVFGRDVPRPRRRPPALEVHHAGICRRCARVDPRLPRPSLSTRPWFAWYRRDPGARSPP